MTEDIRCPECNKLLMTFERLSIDPDDYRGEVQLHNTAAGAHEISECVDIPANILLTGVTIENETMKWGFHLMCARCKTMINIKPTFDDIIPIKNLATDMMCFCPTNISYDIERIDAVNGDGNDARIKK